LDELNVQYSKEIWQICARYEIPLIYASSAATYGDGSLGFDDNHKLPFHLEPLNPYGKSKNEFDKWALEQLENPPFWAGLKFFNVYGPNEYHKGRMASVVYHFYKQVKETQCVRLFRSHRPDYTDGEQLRDFIHVHDLLAVMEFLMKKNEQLVSGLYNVGTGEAQTYNTLAKAIFTSMELYPDITYIDIPQDIRGSYQYFTEANMEKLRNAGYYKSFIPLEKGINQYITEYLIPKRWY
jgi:ADP-L-glycero-D-manno-heptose 6-epimerase